MYDDMKHTVAHGGYALSQLHAHLQPINLKRYFHEVSPTGIISWAWNITTQQNRVRRRSKMSLQTGNATAGKAVHLLFRRGLLFCCWQYACNTLKTAQSSTPRPVREAWESQATILQQWLIKETSSMWHAGACSYQREMSDKILQSMKNTKGKASLPLTLIAAFGKCGSLTVGVSVARQQASFRDQQQTSEGRC